jgi:hypothetical protein
MRLKTIEKILPDAFFQVAVVAALACLVSANVQTASLAQVNNAQGKSVIVPAGTTFEGRIDQTIGSAHTRPGTKFLVTMASPALANGQDVLIPAGSAFIGEVVEAIPSSQIPHGKKMPHKPGKLRVELTGLRMPDGMTYPLVASFVGEVNKNNGGQGGPELGGGVAYIGSQSGFNMVYPRAGGRGGPLVSKQTMMTNPLYGDAEKGGHGGQIRSLVTHGSDLLIHAGSPMSVRLDAPLRMSLTPVPMPAMQPADNQDEAGHRFSHDVPAGTMPQMPQATTPPGAAAPGTAPGAGAPQTVRANPSAPPAPVDTSPSFLTPVPGAMNAMPPPPVAPVAPAAPAVPANTPATAAAPAQPNLPSPVEMMLHNPGPAPFAKSSDMPPMQIDLDHGLGKPASSAFPPAAAPGLPVMPGGAMAPPMGQGLPAMPGGALSPSPTQAMQAVPPGGYTPAPAQDMQAMPPGGYTPAPAQGMQAMPPGAYTQTPPQGTQAMPPGPYTQTPPQGMQAMPPGAYTQTPPQGMQAMPPGALAPNKVPATAVPALSPAGAAPGSSF